MRISYSGLETFSTCPAKYKFQYIDRIKTPKSKDAFFGILIHECLKLFHDPSRTTPMLEDELLKYFTQQWDKDVYQDSQEEAFAFHQGIDILKRYYLQNQNQRFNVVNLETLFQVPILDHQITGRIDRIDKLEDGTFEVIDYKTSKKMPAQEIIDNNFQLSVYYLGLANRWPLLEKENRPVKLSLYYLRHGEKLFAFRDTQEIKKTKEKIVDIINQIDKSKFEPKSNSLCDWCQYQSYCPLYKHKFIKEESPTPNDQRMQDIIKEYFAIKDRQSTENKRLTELKRVINLYCDLKGIDRVFGDEGYITRLPQQRYSYNLIKVKEILEPINKWNEILTIDKTKFKKVIDSLSYDLKKQIDQTKTLKSEFKVISMSRKK
ncbi:PD-(D/E)XK nuclease family protein [Patescibacteria group bacterium]|nr:PD-(D/E)XK nuclease family protein [Patescibacteria group bacterium]MBU1563651.1 PD-(D/E)XK nuclease family protein [Patescibacteria group bacterium]MBU2068069.1 PD-(D/E)XK nuclease family protein [Patescibacteria group bacterium]